MTVEREPGDPLLDRHDRASIAEFLRQLAGPVALDLWTRAEHEPAVPGGDPCTYCGQADELMRSLAALHPGLRLTRYDLDRHAARAATLGIDRAPPVVARGARGASVMITGICSGSLFPALMEGLLYLGAGRAPFRPNSREVLGQLRAPHQITVFLAPYDPISGLLMRLMIGLATEVAGLHMRLIEAAEFPQLAAEHELSVVPLTIIDGRPFAGGWDEVDLVEQLRRIDAGDDVALVRERILQMQFTTFEKLEREAQAAGLEGEKIATPHTNDASPAREIADD